MRRATLDNYGVAHLETDLPAGSLIMARIHGRQDGRLVAAVEAVVREGRR